MLGMTKLPVLAMSALLLAGCNSGSTRQEPVTTPEAPPASAPNKTAVLTAPPADAPKPKPSRSALVGTWQGSYSTNGLGTTTETDAYRADGTFDVVSVQKTVTIGTGGIYTYDDKTKKLTRTTLYTQLPNGPKDYVRSGQFKQVAIKIKWKDNDDISFESARHSVDLKRQAPAATAAPTAKASAKPK